MTCGKGVPHRQSNVPSNIGLQPTAARWIMGPLRLKPHR